MWLEDTFQAIQDNLHGYLDACYGWVYGNISNQELGEGTEVGERREKLHSWFDRPLCRHI
jgi:hypothetical protein